MAIVLYPLLFRLNERWAFTLGGVQGFGVYAGSTIHEVAQVAAAAWSSGPAVADAAVLLLASILFGWLVVGGAAVNHGVRALLA